MSGVVQELDELADARFLSEFWQRRPALIRAGALPKITLSGDELAGLALEQEVESRLIRADRSADEPGAEFELRHGPLPEEIFAELPERDWTLLVHGLDHWLPELNALIRAFPALPRWRLDDIMASYAAPGGGVGPHIDQYDVFLIQHQGQRRWRIGKPGPIAVRPDQPLQLLQDFETVAEVVLTPGDILYLPPGVPHWGTALDECITLSVGFRAPAADDLLLCLAGSAVAERAPLFSDAGRDLAADSAVIESADVERVRALLRPLLDDDAALAEALGQAVTEPTRAPPEPVLPTARRALHPSARLAYWQGPNESLLFVDGVAYPAPAELARALAAGQLSPELARTHRALLKELAAVGVYRG